ncbi:MAG: chromosome segregation protein SMC [Chitinophagales bacterium]|nr:chromosome segregation protein SMC [Chitinophagales bacterium]
MRLSKLEIKGFKSFAEKTVINFNDNITGIVGPNGCGKSNVVDSIRWVLGEQKISQLRLEKMDNVIFNGTKQRKPAGLAEVSLTFENTKNLIPTEYTTVTITRKLFRDGESEYRINDVQCRLKDIHNLFLDTGIGTDSYAIIELGMVDEILQDREHSRRKLFEQAAGVSKYKIRKKETLNKLKGTEEDLTRLEDLLFEIEKNLKSLESQARKAERYVKLREEYKVNSLELTKYKLQNHKTIFSSLKESIQKESDNKTQLDASLNAMEANLQQKKLGSLASEKRLAEVQKKLNELISGLGVNENKRNLLKEQIRFAEEKVEESNRQIAEANDMIERIQVELTNGQAIIAERELLSAKAQEEIEIYNEQLQLIKSKNSSVKSELDEEKKLFSENEKNLYEIEKKLAINKSNVENFKREKEQLLQERMFKQEEMVMLQKGFALIEQNKHRLEADLTKYTAQEEILNEKILLTEKNIEKSKHEIAIENRKLDSKKNEYNLTKSMVDNLEGFPEAIKFLKKNSKVMEVAPLLSDILLCKEEYRIPIENFLEPYLTYYIVQTLGDAVAAVNLLHDSAKGKANFFVLDKINAVKAPSIEIKQGLISALEVLEIDKAYQKLIQHLLANVYIGDINQEAEIEKLGKDGVIVLSKSGKFISRPLSLSGGAVGLFEGKRIGRAKNLEILKQEIEDLERTCTSKEKEIKQLQESLIDYKNASNKSAINALQIEQNSVMQEFTKYNTNIQNFQSFIEGGENKVAVLDENVLNLSKINEELEGKSNQLKSEQDSLKNKIEVFDKEFVEYTYQLNEASAAFNQKNILLIQLQNELRSSLQEETFKKTQLANFQGQLKRSEEVILQTSKLLEENRISLKELEGELLSKYDNKGGIEKEVEESETLYYKSRGEIGELENELREKNRQRDLLNQLINDIQHKLNELKLDINSVKERLSIEFGVDINDLLNQEIVSEKTEEQLDEEVKNIKKKVEGFGEVNPMAIEAYNEIKERYDFLINQKKDLLEAKGNLLSTIKEIDSTAKVQFMEAFTKVRENFIQTFRILFTQDDDCDLILSDTDNPLEASIEIIAKPKGKRPLTISQLSGGEKTLTATALLFSLYLLKPAPFCIFDEVDAPLDDTNIAKFNNIIQKFSQDSQFIIVTHNKQTMASVDVIYGVTMLEQGVSRVVPVDFRSLEN